MPEGVGYPRKKKSFIESLKAGFAPARGDVGFAGSKLDPEEKKRLERLRIQAEEKVRQFEKSKK